MWYFEETKRFWRAGYRLFHGKFLSFMSGPKAMGQLVIGNKELGAIDPSEAFEITMVWKSKKQQQKNKQTNKQKPPNVELHHYQTNCRKLCDNA